MSGPTRPPVLRLGLEDERELVVDMFAGGGGASHALTTALGRAPDVAINHDPQALAMHELNHPTTRHLRSDVWEVDPVEVCGGRPVGLAWFSPDCTHHSKAKGGKPRDRRGASKSRALAHVVVRWARLFVIARCDGRPIVWPEPTHGPGLLPYRTAAECIDWTLPCPSIFGRKRPLAEKTLRRIARGMWRYVIGASQPFVVPLTHGRVNDSAPHGVGAPLRTITGAHRGEIALVSPTLVQTGYGERPGQAPRCLDVQRPLGTIIAGGHGCGNGKHALVAAFLAKHYGGGETKATGSALDSAVGTITTQDHHALVTSFLTKFYGTSTGSRAEDPVPTITTGGGKGGGHLAEVRAFLTTYYGTAEGQSLGEPLRTVTTRDRFALGGAQSFASRPALHRRFSPDLRSVTCLAAGDRDRWFTLAGLRSRPPVAAAGYPQIVHLQVWRKARTFALAAGARLWRLCPVALLVAFRLGGLRAARPGSLARAARPHLTKNARSRFVLPSTPKVAFRRAEGKRAAPSCKRVRDARGRSGAGPDRAIARKVLPHGRCR